MVRIGIYANTIMVTAKNISLPTSCEAAKVSLMIPSFRSSAVAVLNLCTKCAAITQAPSTIIPKSIAPKERRFAGMPISFIRIKANNKENGMVKATTNADRKFPRKSTNTMMTIETPSNKVCETVSRVLSTNDVRS